MLKTLSLVLLTAIFISGCGGSSGGSKKSSSSSSSSSSVAVTSSSVATTSSAKSSSVSSMAPSSSSSVASVAPSSSSSAPASSSAPSSSSSNSSTVVVTSSSEMSSSSAVSSSEMSSSSEASSSVSSSSEASSSSDSSSSSVSSSSSSVAPAPVAVYSFEDNLDEGSGLLASGTVTGNRADNTGGSVSYVTGAVGKSLVLNGSSGVKLANNLITDHSYSISLWLNPASVTQFTPALFGWASATSWISMVPRGPGGAQDTMLWSGTAWFDGTFASQIPTGSWSHLVVTVDNGTLKTYLNGTLTNTLTGFPNVFTGVSSEFSLGVNFWDTPYNGNIDEVKVYNDVLSGDDVTALYNEFETQLDLPIANWYGKNGVAVNTTGGTTVTYAADWNAAGVWVAPASAAIEGHTIEIDVRVSSGFKASGGALYIYSFIDTPPYISESDCSWLNNSQIVASTIQTIACTISTGGSFNQTTAGVEIQLVARTDSGAPNGTVEITGSRVVAP